MLTAFEAFNMARQKADDKKAEYFVHNGKTYYRGSTQSGMVIYKGEHNHDSYRGSGRKRRRRRVRKSGGSGKKRKKSKSRRR